MVNEATPEQLEEWVASGDFHAALQSIGRPRFQPGDGSLSEWVMLEMHVAHFGRSKCKDLSVKPEAYQNLECFVQKVARNQMSKEDHELYWLCYTHLCERYGVQVLPIAYHTVFLDTSPMDLAMSMAQRGDDEGLEIMLYHFDHVLPKLRLIDNLPAFMQAYQYARFVMEDSTVTDDWFDQHVKKRFNITGKVADWVDLFEHYRPDSDLLDLWKRLAYKDALEVATSDQPLVSNGTNCELNVSTDDTVEDTAIYSAREMSDAKQTQDKLPPIMNSSDPEPVFIPFVTPQRDQFEGNTRATLEPNGNDQNGVSNLIVDSPVIKRLLNVEEAYAVSEKTRLEQASEINKKSQAPTLTRHQMVTPEHGVRLSQNRLLQDQIGFETCSTSMRHEVDHSFDVKDRSIPADDAKRPTFIMSGEESVDVQCLNFLSSAHQNDVSQDGDTSLTLKRDLARCINVVKSIIDNAHSHVPLDQDKLLFVLQGLRKDLKQIRKARSSSVDEGRTINDRNDVDANELVSLRTRVTELEKLICQYQSKESLSPSREDQAGQDTHETTTGDTHGKQELMVLSLKDKLTRVQAEFELQKRADAARIRYLRQLLMEREQAIATTPTSTTVGSPLMYPQTSDGRFTPRMSRRSPPIPNSPSTETQLHDLAYALELSEHQRAQALEDLHLEREFYAEKVRSLQRAFRDIMETS